MKHIVKTQKRKKKPLAILVLETLIYNSFYKIKELIEYYHIHKIYDIFEIFTLLVIKSGFTSHNFRLTLRADIDLKSSELKPSLYKKCRL